MSSFSNEMDISSGDNSSTKRERSDILHSPGKDANLRPVNSPSISNTNQRLLNLTLETIFQITLRRDADSQLYYVEADDSTELLSSSNISQYLIMRVMTDSSFSSKSTMLYFIGCYRRLLQKEAMISDKINEEFLRFYCLYCL